MRLLLDTSTLLWWLNAESALGRSARDAISAPDNEVFVSAASAWEISVKRASGKLEAPFDRMLVAQARLEGLTLVAHDPAFARYDVEMLDARA